MCATRVPTRCAGRRANGAHVDAQVPSVAFLSGRGIIRRRISALSRYTERAGRFATASVGWSWKMQTTHASRQRYLVGDARIRHIHVLEGLAATLTWIRRASRQPAPFCRGADAMPHHDHNERNGYRNRRNSTRGYWFGRARPPVRPVNASLPVAAAKYAGGARRRTDVSAAYEARLSRSSGETPAYSQPRVVYAPQPHFQCRIGFLRTIHR